MPVEIELQRTSDGEISPSLVRYLWLWMMCSAFYGTPAKERTVGCVAYGAGGLLKFPLYAIFIANFLLL